MAKRDPFGFMLVERTGIDYGAGRIFLPALKTLRYNNPTAHCVWRVSAGLFGRRQTASADCVDVCFVKEDAEISDEHLRISTCLKNLLILVVPLFLQTML